jgi:hypothetical protein
VRTVQDGLAFGGESGQQILDHVGGIHVESGEGLIHENQVRIVEQ